MYTKKNWVSGETVTATALNNIENGICSLPSPELGKRLEVLVDENQTQEVVVVPEQSVTTTSSGGAQLSNADGDIFNQGFDAILSINNVEHQVSYDSGQYYYTDSSTGCTYNVYMSQPKLAISSTNLKFSVYQNGSYVSGTYIVKLTALAPKAYWGIEQEQEALDPIFDPTSPSEQEEK